MNILMESRLPKSTLDKIWELSDQDKDGFLNKYEWTVASHLTEIAYDDEEIPDEIVISLKSTVKQRPWDQPN